MPGAKPQIGVLNLHLKMTAAVPALPLNGACSSYVANVPTCWLQAFDEGDFIAAQPTQNALLRTNTIPAMHGPPLSPINAHPQQTQPGRNLSNAVPFKRPAAKKTAGGSNAAKIKPHGPPENTTPF